MKDRPGLRSVVIDCGDPQRLAAFWAATLGWRIRPYTDEDVAALAKEGLTPETDPSVCVDPPDPSLPTLWCNKVPESKVGKVRIHLDVNLADRRAMERLIELGASVVEERPGGNDWTIMADPEGHEFCAFVLSEPATAQAVPGQASVL
jgi:catechol 2,3-dioxygenase-like lactoylglutathione lyase family enzyme